MNAQEPNNGESPLTKAFLFVDFWFFLVFMVLLEIGRLPKTALGWVCLVLAGPVIYLAVSAAGGWLLSKKHGELVSRSNSSVGRVAIAFFVLVLIVVADMIFGGLLSDRE
jgi:hypothetical protein